MSESEKTKSPAARKAAPGKAEASAKVAVKSSGPRGGATLCVTQIGSPIGREGWQRATLIGLGLNKRGRTRTLEDTPAVRGMIARVGHLLRIEDAA